MDPNVRQMLLYGTGDKKFKMDYSSDRWSGTYSGGWEGAIPNLMRRYTQTKSSGIREWIEQFMSMRPCSDCKGARLRKETLGVMINEKNIYDSLLEEDGTTSFNSSTVYTELAVPFIFEPGVITNQNSLTEFFVEPSIANKYGTTHIGLRFGFLFN